MSRDELSAGGYAPAHDLVSAISTTHNGEIPQLQALAARLPFAPGSVRGRGHMSL